MVNGLVILAKIRYTSLTMAEKYDHRKIEAKWQARWLKEKIFSVTNDATTPYPSFRKKGADLVYVLDMFPYPSGDGLHVGHPEGYTASDIVSRYLRMNGKTVLHPMGWDAFGLPAENAAIKKKTHPRIVTEQNIKNFKRQIQSIGFSYDWDRELNTTDPKYYRWTQWIFLQLFKKGLAYEAELPIWWCPKDKTGLANEEVIDGCCERCGTKVERKMLRQWVLKITEYAERLLSGLDKLDWPESIKALQRNWIGKSEGAEVKFQIPSTKSQTNSKHQIPNHEVWVFTTRPDTLFGATYLVLSPEHPLVDEITTAEHKKKVASYKLKVASKSDLERTALEKEKTGVFTGAYAINPVNHEQIPVWIADYVLMSYGTGAIMAVPAHDERDYEFAKKFDLPIREVVVPYRYYDPNPPRPGKKTVERRNVHAIVTDPETGKILALKWTKHPWTTFPMGGIDGDEDIVKAAEREVREETGYTDLKFEKVLGGQVKAEYFAAHKDENRISFTSAVVFTLRSKKRAKVDAAELAEHEIIWLDPVKMHPDHMIHAELDVWLSRLSKDEPAYTGEGVMMNSRVVLPSSPVPPSPLEVAAGPAGYGHLGNELEPVGYAGPSNGMSSEKFRKEIVSWLETQGKAKSKVNYKLRDWIFSRQRYWGEPIPLTHCESCKQTVESTKHYLHFSDRATWEELLSGEKTVETRALNPEEPERYFGNISAGHATSDSYIKGIFKPTGETTFFRVKKVTKYKSLAELFKDKNVHRHIWPHRTYSTLKELEASREAYGADYAEKIKKNGLITFEVKHVLPGIILVPEKELPLLLPDVEKYEPTGTGESPLASVKDWVNVTCRICGHPAKRETNTMPQWAGSCWYYIRFTDPQNDKAMASDAAMKAWLPVDTYVGGAEHAVLHLLYSRFWHKVLFDVGAIPKEVGDEPFMKLKNQGLILGPDGEKMSKSRGNVINPDDIIEQYGADTLRMYEMFMGPFEDAKPWSTESIIGVRRFLDRVWALQSKVDYDEPARTSASHKYIAAITKGIENFQFNTCVSDLMKWSNEWKSAQSIPSEDFSVFLKLLSPLAPHICEELWQVTNHETLLAQEPWPDYDPDLVKEDTVTIAIQVNGKHRGNVTVPSGADEKSVLEAGKQEPNVKKYLSGEPKKVIFVKDRLINFVV